LTQGIAIMRTSIMPFLMMKTAVPFLILLQLLRNVEKEINKE